MTKTLQKHGNSMALLIDKSLMEMLNIEADTPLNITIREGSMVITPVNVGIPSEELQDYIKELRPHHKTMLENLAK